MNYLLNLGISQPTVSYLQQTISKEYLDGLTQYSYIVKDNINFLKNLGVGPYDEIFKSFYEIFLMDPKDFSAIFTKYDKTDLLSKLRKNPAIVEYL